MLIDQVMFQYREGGRTDIQHFFVEFFQAEVIPPVFSYRIPKICKAKKSHIIFQVICRGLYKRIVEGICGGTTLKANLCQIVSNLLPGVAVVIDSNIQSAGNTQDQGTVQAVQVCSGGVRVCQRIGIHFYIGGPSLHISAKIQDAPHFIGRNAAGADRLIEVSRVSLVGKGGVQLQRSVAGGRC